jgi:hypothetical protein
VTEHKKYSCVNKNEPKTGVFADLLLFWFVSVVSVLFTVDSFYLSGKDDLCNVFAAYLHPRCQ